jgi:hypothetical protein
MTPSNTPIQQNNLEIITNSLPVHIQNKISEAISLINEVHDVNPSEAIQLTDRLMKILGRSV